MKSILFFCVGLILFASCAKEGTGGDATLVVFLKHHTKVIPNKAWYPDTVFVKFNAKELPGTKVSDFDTYFVGEAGEDHVHCEELKWGDYYLYGVGFDTTISQKVSGGMAVKIKRKDRKAETDIDLAVTE
jgi:hypothetical protein